MAFNLLLPDTFTKYQVMLNEIMWAVASQQEVHNTYLAKFLPLEVHWRFLCKTFSLFTCKTMSFKCHMLPVETHQARTNFLTFIDVALVDGYLYSPILGSRGSFPRNGTFISSAIFSAPPVVGGKICDSF